MMNKKPLGPDIKTKEHGSKALASEALRMASPLEWLQLTLIGSGGGGTIQTHTTSSIQPLSNVVSIVIKVNFYPHGLPVGLFNYLFIYLYIPLFKYAIIYSTIYLFMVTILDGLYSLQYSQWKKNSVTLPASKRPSILISVQNTQIFANR